MKIADLISKLLDYFSSLEFEDTKGAVSVENELSVDENAKIINDAYSGMYGDLEIMGINYMDQIPD